MVASILLLLAAWVGPDAVTVSVDPPKPGPNQQVFVDIKGSDITEVSVLSSREDVGCRTVKLADGGWLAITQAPSSGGYSVYVAVTRKSGLYHQKHVIVPGVQPVPTPTPVPPGPAPTPGPVEEGKRFILIVEETGDRSPAMNSFVFNLRQDKALETKHMPPLIVDDDQTRDPNIASWIKKASPERPALIISDLKSNVLYNGRCPTAKAEFDKILKEAGG